MYERFVFYKREQIEGESVEYFVKELKKLVKNCVFANQTDIMIRDRIVLGVKDIELQEKLLNIKELDPVKAIEVAKNNEITKQQVKEVQKENFVSKNVELLKTRRPKKYEV